MPDAIAAIEATTAGRASMVSMTEVSSPAWTIGVVVQVTASTVAIGGRFRFEGPYPASYEGTSPHIHLRIVASGHEVLLSRYVPARGARRGSMRLVLEPQAV